jgi:thiol-disulfide isomerase/thioredoxin
MEGRGKGMRLKIGSAGLLLAAGVALAAAQSSAPKDLPRMDNQGYEKIVRQYKGQPLLVTFWATWCEPCRDEYPMLNELAKQYAPQGLKVVGISMDQDGDLILMRRFLARYKPVFPNYRKIKGDEDAFSNAVMPGWKGALPASFFYARDGSQVGHVVGASNHDTYDAAIRAVLSK